MMRSTWILGFSILLLSACGSDNETDFGENNAGGSDAGVDSGDGTGGRGGSGGSSGSGGMATGGSGPEECGDTTCTAPATCDESGSEPRCVCPEGYEDTNGDGSECGDIDECEEETDDCGDNTECENTDGGFECPCAEGYTEVSGECLKENIGTCTDGAECASGNCVGGVCCAEACDSPGSCQVLEGTICLNGDTCEYGTIPDDTECDTGDMCTTGTCFEGDCVPVTQTDCDDQDACTEDSCEPTTGECVHGPVNCDDNNPCTNDLCNATTGCRYTNNNTASCTDGDDCTNDRCMGGICQSTPMNCSNLTDDCNEGVCVGGACQAQPANQGGDCDQGLDACDAAGSCNASGTCVGDDDACGSLATSCMTCTGTGTCTQGRRCTCRASTAQEPEIVINTQTGMCEFNENECNPNPCDDIAVSCNDPTPDGSATGDYVCTCPSGYTGNGRGSNGCVDINECQNANPCGVGATATGCNGTSPPGSYSCTCRAGYMSIQTPTGPTCVCDLRGTYAMVTTATATYEAVLVDIGIGDPIEVLEESGPGLEFHSWALRHHTVQPNGTLRVETIPCGGSTPTLCSPFVSRALAQFQANQVWGRATINSGFGPVSVPLQGVVQGGSYVEPQTVVTTGIILDDPDGPWPPCAACIGVAQGGTCTCQGVQHTVTNRAQWFDSDGDSNQGITTYAVPEGGDTIGSGGQDPPFDYTEPTECPRFTTGGPYPYGAWPGTLEGQIFPFYTLEWHGASRITSRVQDMSIAYSSGQCRVAGSITGPDSGRALTEARIGGCRTCGSFGCAAPTGNCSAAQARFYDEVEQSQTIASANFTLNRMTSIDLGPILAMPNNATKANLLNQACQEVREMNCPAGKTCAP